jgi:hypothetical protein
VWVVVEAESAEAVRALYGTQELAAAVVAAALAAGVAPETVDFIAVADPAVVRAQVAVRVAVQDQAAVPALS